MGAFRALLGHLQPQSPHTTSCCEQKGAPRNPAKKKLETKGVVFHGTLFVCLEEDQRGSQHFRGFPIFLDTPVHFQNTQKVPVEKVMFKLAWKGNMGTLFG